MSSAPPLRRKRRLPHKSPRSPLYSPLGRDRVREEPFYITFLKTGSILLVLCMAGYLVLVLRASSYQEDDIPYREHLVVKHVKENEQVKDDGKVTTLPQFSLGSSSQNDAFGIADKYLSNVGESAPNEVIQFLDAAKALRTEFSKRYGGEISARALLERSLVVLKKNATAVDAMALRIQKARNTGGIFQVAIGGSSVAAGCGNFYHQSFPFVMERLMADLFGLLGLTLQVRNAAMEDVPVFPYTWCHSNFLGEDVDVASMDFGAIPVKHMDAMIRNMIGTTKYPPILIFRDVMQVRERQSLLQRYV